MQDGKILVVGATGRVGGAAAELLLEAGFEVRALVRRPEKGERLRSLGAELAVGDATAPDTLGPALRGCCGIFSALGAGPGRGPGALSTALSIWRTIRWPKTSGRSARRPASRGSCWPQRTSPRPSCARPYSWRRSI